jgi:lysophospholipase L1-like esterase
LRNQTTKLFVFFILAIFLLLSEVLAQEIEQNYWEEAIQKFEANDKLNPPQKGSVLFVGSSSIRMWKSLSEDFPFTNVLNRGFGGSQMSDLRHFVYRIIIRYKPQKIFIYEGDNDIADDKSPEFILNDFINLVITIREELPEVPIYFISVKPSPSRWKWEKEYKETNRLFKNYIATNKEQKLHFIDVFTAMLGDDGKPKPDIFLKDQLHMNAKGYKLWKKLIEPELRK